MYKYFLIIILFTTSLYSQSVDSLINLALKNNPLLKAYKSRVIANKSNAESISQLPPPTLGIEFNQIPFNSANIWNDAESNALSLSQMFMLGGKFSAMRDVELKSISIENSNLNNAAINIIAEIKMNYYNLWLTERKIEIQNKTILLLEQLIKSLTIEFSTNRVNQADILSLTAEVYSNNTQVSNLKNDRQKYINLINRYIGISLDSIITSSEINTNISINEKELESILINENPTLQKMNAMVEMNRAMIISNSRDKIPDLMLQGMVMRMPLGMPLTTRSDLSMLSMTEAKTEYMYSIMASITLPFAPWSSNKYKYKEEELTAAIKGIEYEKEDMKNEMLSRLRNSIIKLNNAKNLLELYGKNVIPVYEKALDAQIIFYQTNRTNLNSVVDALRMLLMEQMNYYMALADIQMSAAEIEMIAGRSNFNINYDQE